MEAHPGHVHRTRRNFVWITLVAVLVLALVSGSFFALRSVLFANHNAGPDHTPGVTTPLPKETPKVTPTSVVTQPVPPTQKDCPAANTARAMVTAPLAQGKDPQIVYIPQTGTNILIRNRLILYNTVTHTSTELLNVSPGIIRSAVLSADGQWVLIGYADPAHASVPSSSYVQLQAMRIDGQGLQTLYCGQATRLTWSPNRHWIAFDGPIQAYGSADTIQMIDTTTGQLLSVVDVPEQYNIPNPHNPTPAFWLSNTQLYLQDLSGTTPFNTYLVDTANGEHQSPSSLKVVIQQKDSYTGAAVADGKNLFINEITCSNSKSTCSPDQEKTALVRVPAQGGTPEMIFQDPQLFINGIGLVNGQDIMTVVSNQSNGTRQILIVKGDGSGQTVLASAKAVFGTGNSQVNPYTGGVLLSADGHHFVVMGWPTPDGKSTQICYGSSGSSVLTSWDTNGNSVLVLGWTQL